MNEGRELSPTTQQNEAVVARKGNVVTITKNGARYTFVYNNAFSPKDYSKDLPRNSNGLVLETGTNHWIEDPMRYLQEHKANTSYFNLFNTLEKKKIPLFFADVGYKNDLKGHVPLVASVLALGAETVIGIELLRRITHLKKTRRSFISSAVKAAAGAFLAAPGLSYIAGVTSSASEVGEEHATNLIKSINTAHPEVSFFITELRNIVIAHKEEWLSVKKRKPHLATLIGGGHANIEEQIQHTSQERIDFLRKIKPLLKEIISPEEFYRIAEFTYDGDDWRLQEIYEVSELKELITT